jgi:orotidine-5'-phosphate decarboxylase
MNDYPVLFYNRTRRSVMKARDRLILALDYNPTKLDGGATEVYAMVMALALKMKGTGAIIKLNSILRRFGEDLIDRLHDLDLRVMADFKLHDIPATMEIDAAFLQAHKPELLTVMCAAGPGGMGRVQRVLSETTEVLGVTVLTSMDDKKCEAVYGEEVEATVLRLAKLAAQASIGGLVCSPHEAGLLSTTKDVCMLTRNTPAIRPNWSQVQGDDQAKGRKATPADAIREGATRVVVGRPITGAEDPIEAYDRTLEEIDEALAG